MRAAAREPYSWRDVPSMQLALDSWSWDAGREGVACDEEAAVAAVAHLRSWQVTHARAKGARWYTNKVKQ